ncbi:hypothetical protein M422DRAFT_774896 [Sphaerobolus stellatus SS14]|nr:hypothetical protein M422DRAFT_774896 [Sphaerobolus stellatus SS14]
MFYRGNGFAHHNVRQGSLFGFANATEPIKYIINSRVMIDRVNFWKMNPNHRVIEKSRLLSNHNDRILTELTDDDFLITTPLLYGFSFADNLWNEDALTNHFIPGEDKILLQGLVEAYYLGDILNDFIKGKGQGVIINLFGPPGVGKTFTAEATSQHVKKPLYVVGSGDLGTNPTELDNKPQQIFHLAAAWKAIVLIEGADIFFEERSLQDRERNTMVTILLRHLEYYPAILFLAINRLQTFNDTFFSRTHVTLHFSELTEDALRTIWTVLLGKVGVSIGYNEAVSNNQLDYLAKRRINGRQFKNAVKTAKSLALSRGEEKIRYEHLEQVMNVIEKFEVYRKLRAGHG